NVDGHTVNQVLKTCQPLSTLCIINSKTFTTLETLQNAKTMKEWFEKAKALVKKQLIAVTAHKERALAFGISKDNIFEFWDFVGGLYSVCSAVGWPIALQLGMKNFQDFLAGAKAMDEHFRSAPFRHNMPVLMALLGIWNINFGGATTQAILPYDDALKQLPAY